MVPEAGGGGPGDWSQDGEDRRVQVLSAAKNRISQRGCPVFLCPQREGLEPPKPARETIGAKRHRDGAGSRRRRSRRLEPGWRGSQGSSPLCRKKTGYPNGVSGFFMPAERDLNLRSPGARRLGAKRHRDGAGSRRRRSRRLETGWRGSQGSSPLCRSKNRISRLQESIPSHEYGLYLLQFLVDHWAMEI